MPGFAPDFKEEKEYCKKFLQNYIGEPTPDDPAPKPKYMAILQEVSNRARKTVEIELDDIANSQDASFLKNVETNTRRYIQLFSEAIDEVMPKPDNPVGPDDLYDILTQHRMEASAENGGEGVAGDPAEQLPAELKRRYEIHMVPRTFDNKPVVIRDIKASDIGHLVKVKGIVTRCTDVKPLIAVAVYTCEDCSFEIYQEVNGRQFMPLNECPSQRCRTNGTKGRLHLQSRGSKFLKFQEAKIQELADQVPIGHIPRTMTIHIKGELTRKLGPGDLVCVSGIFLPTPYTGFKQMRAGLVADTYLEASNIVQLKKRYEEYVLMPETLSEVERLAEGGDTYSRLAKSIAPEIFGHEDVKKALLLLLVGGSTRQLKDGMKIRGDLHVCLMGDPGVAKSQLLKHMVTVAPRGVYTTGRGSSGVGLTAAVQKDNVTGEMVLEGGALVLADMGICCIDEFDKMDESDRTAIHEVMEQQTVSIAKAGITTTLNARTSVLAAANPAWGRYDMRRSPAENINLPPALLSRFDIMWLILDRPNLNADASLARHVLHVHRHLRAPELGFEPVSSATLRAYVATARKHTPYIPRALTEYLAGAYSTLRQEEAQSDAPHTYTTARTLLSILRLSQALARLRFAEEVAQSDVDEALRLMQMSKMSLYEDKMARSGLDPISDIYTMIRDHAQQDNSLDVKYTDAVNWCTAKGYSMEQLAECLEEYASLNVWQVNPTTNDIHFIPT